MATLAPHSFWLDNASDLASVEACRFHPRHHWWRFRLGDVLAQTSTPNIEMVICRCCYVPRCGVIADPDPCILWRHHTGLHVMNQWAH
jgi:hypothetical protein